MKMPKDAVAPIVRGEKLNLFQNSGDENGLSLTALPDAAISSENRGSGGHHQSSSDNPSNSQLDEENIAAGTAQHLDKQVLDGKINKLVIVAAPRTLGDLHKHYNKQLSAIHAGEISKFFNGHAMSDIEKTIAAV